MSKYLDYLKCIVYQNLWDVWHIHMTRFYDTRRSKRLERKYSDAALTINQLTPEFYKRDLFIQPYDERWGQYRGRGVSRPWHHLCCNGDAGGWRTRVCDHLEKGFRFTDHYNRDTGNLWDASLDVWENPDLSGYVPGEESRIAVRAQLIHMVDMIDEETGETWNTKGEKQ